MIPLIEFATKFHELLEKDSPRGISATAQRTLLDSEADKLMADLWEYLVATCGLSISDGALARALAKTRGVRSEQDRATAILKLLST